MGIVGRNVTDKKLSADDLEFTSKRASAGEWVGRFIVDTNTKQMYAIPGQIDHPEFIVALTGKTLLQLKTAPLTFANFVAVSMAVVNGIVTRSVIGISGFEMVMVSAVKKSVKSQNPIEYHSLRQLDTARRVAQNYLFGGQFPIIREYKEQLVRRI